MEKYYVPYTGNVVRYLVSLPYGLLPVYLNRPIVRFCFTSVIKHFYYIVAEKGLLFFVSQTALLNLIDVNNVFQTVTNKKISFLTFDFFNLLQSTVVRYYYQ